MENRRTEVVQPASRMPAVSQEGEKKYVIRMSNDGYLEALYERETIGPVTIQRELRPARRISWIDVAFYSAALTVIVLGLNRFF